MLWEMNPQYMDSNRSVAINHYNTVDYSHIVEMGGLEPPSNQTIQKFSTYLALL